MITIRIHKIFCKLYPCLTICTTKKYEQNLLIQGFTSNWDEQKNLLLSWRNCKESVKHKILIASPFNNFFHSANKRHFFFIFLNSLIIMMSTRLICLTNRIIEAYKRRNENFCFWFNFALYKIIYVKTIKFQFIDMCDMLIWQPF